MSRLATILALVFAPAMLTAQRSPLQPDSRPGVDTASVSVTRPTVLAYLVVPAGAVDTSASLAVLADDWNVAMATLGDSLEAAGIRFALVTETRLRVRTGRRRDVVLHLDAEPAAGYVFARPGMAPCVRRGAAEADEVLRVARALLGERAPSEVAWRAACGERSRRTGA